MLSTPGVGLLLALVNLCPKQIKKYMFIMEKKRPRPSNQHDETKFFPVKFVLPNNPKTG